MSETNEMGRDLKRRNLVLAMVHAALAAVILAAFVYAQMHR